MKAKTFIIIASWFKDFQGLIMLQACNSIQSKMPHESLRI